MTRGVVVLALVLISATEASKFLEDRTKASQIAAMSYSDDGITSEDMATVDADIPSEGGGDDIAVSDYDSVGVLEDGSLEEDQESTDNIEYMGSLGEQVIDEAPVDGQSVAKDERPETFLQESASEATELIDDDLDETAADAGDEATNEDAEEAFETTDEASNGAFKEDADEATEEAGSIADDATSEAGSEATEKADHVVDEATADIDDASKKIDEATDEAIKTDANEASEKADEVDDEDVKEGAKEASEKADGTADKTVKEDDEISEETKDDADAESENAEKIVDGTHAETADIDESPEEAAAEESDDQPDADLSSVLNDLDAGEASSDAGSSDEATTQSEAPAKVAQKTKLRVKKSKTSSALSSPSKQSTKEQSKMGTKETLTKTSSQAHQQTVPASGGVSADEEEDAERPTKEGERLSGHDTQPAEDLNVDEIASSKNVAHRRAARPTNEAPRMPVDENTNSAEDLVVDESAVSKHVAPQDAAVKVEQPKDKMAGLSDHEKLLRNLEVEQLKEFVVTNKVFKEKVHRMCDNYPNLQNCEASTTEVVFCQLLRKTKPKDIVDPICKHVVKDPTQLFTQKLPKKTSLPSIASKIQFEFRSWEEDLANEMDRSYIRGSGAPGSARR